MHTEASFGEVSIKILFQTDKAQIRGRGTVVVGKDAEL